MVEHDQRYASVPADRSFHPVTVVRHSCMEEKASTGGLVYWERLAPKGSLSDTSSIRRDTLGSGKPNL